MTNPNRELDVSVETPLDDRIEQLAPLDEDYDDDELSSVGALDLDRADEADVLEQSKSVPYDDDYPQG
jgi:hypothetical protein